MTCGKREDYCACDVRERDVTGRQAAVCGKDVARKC